ncbi:YbdD/YjiX family protein [Rhodovastum atsumiense]|uniref:YbdD/YjiX family protein n=1 Tax=Rhodovastum atsumiense TaxID=504468 RepID=A0A5M6IPB2_9PROT|nr:YbdD/YjiX family protein [Rhodovastum atsumiense]KAA5610113.1 YbdD/YjiX family protein [Rhodovastum atsumiense]CAH2601414.1 YbdD/YjiX family protein [Rhodovastum atsumiense]
MSLPCALCDLGSSARLFGRRLKETANLMVGLPDYDTYVAHRQARHPDLPVMTREEFFRDRQSRRYGTGGGLRCC